MMTDYLLLAIGSFFVSSAITYAWWSKVRVTFLREKLFRIRDELWNAALREQGFSDKAYQNARNHLNGSIHMAYVWGIPVIEAIDKTALSVPIAPKPKSDNQTLQAAIIKSYEDSSDCVVNYMIFWRASGWLFLLKMISRSVVDASFNRMQMRWRSIKTWLSSTTPEELRQVDEISHNSFA